MKVKTITETFSQPKEEACGVDDSIIPLVGDTPEGSVVDDEEEDEEVEDEE
jgi:hypothetical protein